MRQGNGDTRPGRLITASEIACWAYCPEQWRLQYGQGLEPGNRTAMAAGTHHHACKAIAERLAGLLLTSGRLLVVITLLVLLALLWLSR